MSLRQTIIATLFFGISMSAFYLWNDLAWSSVVQGMLSGVFFGVTVWLIARSAHLQKQMELDPERLLSGEQILHTQHANLIVRPKDFKLKRFVADSLFWVVGMKDKESLGGKLYLTNYRLILKTHRYNRIRGTVSIFLPTIEKVKGSSRFWVLEKIVVKTTAGPVEVAIENPHVIAAKITDVKDAMDKETINALGQLILANPEKCSDALEKWKEANVVNNLLLIQDRGSEVAEIIISPVGALSVLFLQAFLEKTSAMTERNRGRYGEEGAD